MTTSPYSTNSPTNDKRDNHLYLNWRECPNPPTGDRARDFGIADRLGYRFAYRRFFSRHFLEVFTPNGAFAGTAFWNPDNPLDSSAIAPYSTDLNAAWSLLKGLKAEITLKTYPDGQRTLVSWWDKVWNTGVAETPALAICNAWLNWWDWQHEHGDAEAAPPPDSPQRGGAE